MQQLCILKKFIRWLILTYLGRQPLNTSRCLYKIPCRLIDCDGAAPAFAADVVDDVVVFTSVLTIELCSCMAASGDMPLNEIQDSHFDRRTVLELWSSTE